MDLKKLHIVLVLSFVFLISARRSNSIGLVFAVIRV